VLVVGLNGEHAPTFGDLLEDRRLRAVRDEVIDDDQEEACPKSCQVPARVRVFSLR
jgi:hypothetical protein